MINTDYIWQVDLPEKLETVSNELNPVILQLLKRRGITTPEEIERFIHPDLNSLYNPMLLKDMDKAVKRIRHALDEGEKITVFGDYDVDGITSTCILVKLLKKLGGHVDYYIPSRLHEGYGLNKEAIDTIHKGGTKLIITVDNGINSIEEVNFAGELGVDVVITDHHEPQEFLPEACAIVNPKQRDCPYPFKELAGVGVALKLAQVITELDSESLQEYIELAAIGTVADIVPLVDENRIIVKNGLSFLENTKNIGLQTLKTLLNLNETSFDTFKIGFIVAPRLNATGRMADPGVAVELLLCEDANNAAELAEAIQKINQQRQATEAKILAEAKEMVERDINLDMEGIIVASDPTWHPGVLGTVASKLVEIYHRPCILIVEEGDEGRGSGRSVKGINLFDAVSKVSHRLIRYGGHEQALGLSIKTDDIRAFRDELNVLISEELKDIDLTPKIEVDMELLPENINLDLAEQLELMEPFGCGNPKPVFMCRNLAIKNTRTVGGGNKHLKLNLAKADKPLAAIGFNLGTYEEDLNFAPVLDAVFYLEVNRWQGFVEPQLNIKDIKVPYIQDELLNRIEESYYQSFFSEIEELPILEDVKTLDIDFLERYKRDCVGSLFKTDRRVLLVANTPYGARHLMARICAMDGIEDDFEVFYDLSIKTQRSAHCILINPFTSLGEVDFDDIVFCDLPFNPELLNKQLSSAPSTSKVHVLFNQEDIRYNHMVCCKVLPSINDIRTIYIMLRKVTSGSFVGTINLREFNHFLKNYLECDTHYIGLLNVFKIFKEMDIIDFYTKGDFITITEYKKHDHKLKLESSPTYKTLNTFKKRVSQLKDNFGYLKSLNSREEE